MRKLTKRGRVLLVLAGGVAALLVALAVFLFAPPKFRLRGGESVRVERGSAYSDAGVTARAWGRDLSGRVSVTGKVDTAARGEYTLTYTLRYHGRRYVTRRRVRVADFTPPELTLLGDGTVTVSLKKLYKEPGFTATDNLDGDITGSVRVTEEGAGEDGYTLVYTVTDSDGNRVKLRRKVIIKDIVPPEVTLKSGEYITVVTGEKYAEPGFSAVDDKDGDLTKRVKTSGKVDTSRPGRQTVTYTVSDAAGNTATVVRTVTVITPEDAAASRVFLTFDDGPSLSVTPRILDILKKNGVKATFFIVDYTEEEKPVIKRMIDEGHTVGIHGYSHDYKTAYSSVAAYMDNITKLAEKLRRDFGYTATITRFLGGSSNTISKKYSSGIMTRLVREVAAKGYSYFDWNVDSGDANGNNVAKGKIAANTKEGLLHGRDNVVLMHDIDTKRTTADALQEIINYAKANAYTFAALSDSVPPVHHRVNN